MKKKILFLGFIVSMFVMLMMLPASAFEFPDSDHYCDSCSGSYWQFDATNHCDSVCQCTWKICTECGNNSVLEYCGRVHNVDLASGFASGSGEKTINKSCTKCAKAISMTFTAHTCSYSSRRVDPTCISYGYTEFYCAGHDSCPYNDGLYRSSNRWAYSDPLSDHSLEFSFTQEANCVYNGYDLYTCSNCLLQARKNIVPAGAHSSSSAPERVVPPTCLEDGYSQYLCDICSAFYRSDIVSATGHDYSSEITRTSSCTQDGVLTYSCKNCSDTYTETIPKTGHETSVRARFTEEGQFVVYETCSLCFADFSVVDPCHSCVPYRYSCECGYGWESDSAWGGLTFSTTALGRLDYSDSCSDCGTTFSFSLWSAHYYIRTIQDGKIYDICDNCGKQIYIEDYNPDVGGDEDPDCVHDYARVYYPPSCVDRGYYMYVCIKCSSSYIDSYVDALGHDPKSTVIAPTCTTEGYTDNVCMRDGCGEDWVSDRVPPLGHNFVNGFCTRCGKDEKCVHTYLESVVPPSCHDFGYTLYTCTQCGDTYMDNYTKQLAHQWRVDGVRNPTCELFGYKELTCTLCGEFDTEDINPYGHKWIPKGSVVRDDKTVDVTSVCSSCGKSKVENLQTAAAQAQNWLLTAFSGLSAGIIDMYNTVANGVEVGGVTAGEVLAGCLVLVIVLGFLGFLWNRGVRK